MFLIVIDVDDLIEHWRVKFWHLSSNMQDISVPPVSLYYHIYTHRLVQPRHVGAHQPVPQRPQPAVAVPGVVVEGEAVQGLAQRLGHGLHLAQEVI